MNMQRNKAAAATSLIVSACGVAYLAVASVFEGAGKGTAMIGVLPFAILTAVLSRSSNQRSLARMTVPGAARTRLAMEP